MSSGHMRGGEALSGWGGPSGPTHTVRVWVLQGSPRHIHGHMPLDPLQALTVVSERRMDVGSRVTQLPLPGRQDNGPFCGHTCPPTLPSLPCAQPRPLNP